MMVAPLIWGAISLAGFLVSMYFYEQQEGQMDAILQEFQDLLDRIIIGEPMTFNQFIEAGGWIFILGGFVLLLVFLLIAFPNPNKKKKRRL